MLLEKRKDLHARSHFVESESIIIGMLLTPSPIIAIYFFSQNKNQGRLTAEKVEVSVFSPPTSQKKHNFFLKSMENKIINAEIRPFFYKVPPVKN